MKATTSAGTTPISRTKVTVPQLREARAKREPLVVVTAYDVTMARLLDEAGVDVLMVGDSLGMVVQGHSSTLSVTLEQMIYHVSAVARARPLAHIVGDLPFMSYQISVEQGMRSAGRLVAEGGAESVKLEGGQSVADTVRAIVRAGIPVMGHIGLTPQSVHAMGGFRVQGRTREAAIELEQDARALEDAGVYAIVVEGVPSDVGQAITDAVRVPTIGIGAGPHMSGQVLVGYDLLGMYRGHRPKFVKVFADVGTAIVDGVRAYASEVRAGTFPDVEHQFGARVESGVAASEATAPERALPLGAAGYGPKAGPA